MDSGFRRNDAYHDWGWRPALERLLNGWRRLMEVYGLMRCNRESKD
jgi:hypothetical protein